jgi:hypothetical protein
VQDAVVLHVAAGADHDGPEVGRSTAPYQTLAPAATVTSPTSTAVGATKAPGSTTGRRPANSISNAIRPQPSSLGWSGRRRASAVRTPWGARSRVSCCVLVLVDQATEDVAAT